jgi:hypothetical protein
VEDEILEGGASGPVQDEIDAMRISLYERTKGMSADERANFAIEQAAHLVKQCGIKTVSLKDRKKPEKPENL